MQRRCRSNVGSFDIVASARTLHHVPRPELVLAEMNRVLRPGGTMVVIDQLAPGDPLAAIELNTFERARDPSTTRILADVDLRGLFDSNTLVLHHAEVVREDRDLDRYLDLAGCHGDERERAVTLAPDAQHRGVRLVRAREAGLSSVFRATKSDKRVESGAFPAVHFVSGGAATNGSSLPASAEAIFRFTSPG